MNIEFCLFCHEAHTCRTDCDYDVLRSTILKLRREVGHLNERHELNSLLKTSERLTRWEADLEEREAKLKEALNGNPAQKISQY